MVHWRLVSLVAMVGLIGLLDGVEASAGDRDFAYRSCRARCAADICGQSESIAKWRILFGWSCEDDCSYTCMHSITEQRLASGLPVLQYHGKWPFYRLAQVVQEPASVAFSVMNLVANVVGLSWFRSVPAARRYPMYNLYHLHCLISVNAWLWSCVFHTRDLLLTEQLDYFSATAVVLFSVYCSLVRMALLRHRVLQGFTAVVLLVSFGCHVGYLSLVKFDYGYNMMANVSIAAVNMCLWLLWCFRNMSRQPYVWKCASVLLSTAMFMLLELGDFPPLWFVLDAHSLWHLATSPLPLLWYSFLIDDVNFMAEEAKKLL